MASPEEIEAKAQEILEILNRPGADPSSVRKNVFKGKDWDKSSIAAVEIKISTAPMPEVDEFIAAGKSGPSKWALPKFSGKPPEKASEISPPVKTQNKENTMGPEKSAEELKTESYELKHQDWSMQNKINNPANQSEVPKLNNDRLQLLQKLKSSLENWQKTEYKEKGEGWKKNVSIIADEIGKCNDSIKQTTAAINQPGNRSRSGAVVLPQPIHRMGK